MVHDYEYEIRSNTRPYVNVGNGELEMRDALFLLSKDLERVLKDGKIGETISITMKIIEPQVY